jgi:hypothetical protein
MQKHFLRGRTRLTRNTTIVVVVDDLVTVGRQRMTQRTLQQRVVCACSLRRHVSDEDAGPSSVPPSSFATDMFLSARVGAADWSTTTRCELLSQLLQSLAVASPAPPAVPASEFARDVQSFLGMLAPASPTTSRRRASQTPVSIPVLRCPAANFPSQPDDHAPQPHDDETFRALASDAELRAVLEESDPLVPLRLQILLTQPVVVPLFVNDVRHRAIHSSKNSGELAFGVAASTFGPFTRHPISLSLLPTWADPVRRLVDLFGDESEPAAAQEELLLVRACSHSELNSVMTAVDDERAEGVYSAVSPGTSRDIPPAVLGGSAISAIFVIRALRCSTPTFEVFSNGFLRRVEVMQRAWRCRSARLVVRTKRVERHAALAEMHDENLREAAAIAIQTRIRGCLTRRSHPTSRRTSSVAAASCDPSPHHHTASVASTRRTPGLAPAPRTQQQLQQDRPRGAASAAPPRPTPSVSLLQSSSTGSFAVAAAPSWAYRPVTESLVHQLYTSAGLSVYPEYGSEEYLRRTAAAAVVQCATRKMLARVERRRRAALRDRVLAVNDEVTREDYPVRAAAATVAQRAARGMLARLERRRRQFARDQVLAANDAAAVDATPLLPSAPRSQQSSSPPPSSSGDLVLYVAAVVIQAAVRRMFARVIRATRQAQVKAYLEQLQSGALSAVTAAATSVVRTPAPPPPPPVQASADATADAATAVKSMRAGEGARLQRRQPAKTESERVDGGDGREGTHVLEVTVDIHGASLGTVFSWAAAAGAIVAAGGTLPFSTAAAAGMSTESQLAHRFAFGLHALHDACCSVPSRYLPGFQPARWHQSLAAKARDFNEIMRGRQNLITRRTQRSLIPPSSSVVMSPSGGTSTSVGGSGAGTSLLYSTDDPAGQRVLARELRTRTLERDEINALMAAAQDAAAGALLRSQAREEVRRHEQFRELVRTSPRFRLLAQAQLETRAGRHQGGATVGTASTSTSSATNSGAVVQSARQLVPAPPAGAARGATLRRGGGDIPRTARPTPGDTLLAARAELGVSRPDERRFRESDGRSPGQEQLNHGAVDSPVDTSGADPERLSPSGDRALRATKKQYLDAIMAHHIESQRAKRRSRPR